MKSTLLLASCVYGAEISLGTIISGTSYNLDASYEINGGNIYFTTELSVPSNGFEAGNIFQTFLQWTSQDETVSRFDVATCQTSPWAGKTAIDTVEITTTDYITKGTTGLA